MYLFACETFKHTRGGEGMDRGREIRPGGGGGGDDMCCFCSGDKSIICGWSSG